MFDMQQIQQEWSRSPNKKYWDTAIEGYIASRRIRRDYINEGVIKPVQPEYGVYIHPKTGRAYISLCGFVDSQNGKTKSVFVESFWECRHEGISKQKATNSIRQLNRRKNNETSNHI